MQESLSELRLDIHCARNGREALSLAANFPVALCIVDVELPDIEGTSLIKSLRAIRPDAKILINTIHEEIWYVRNYLKEKVDGIMFKTADGTEIAEGIRTVLGGNRYYCPRAKAIVNIIEQTELPTPKESKSSISSPPVLAARRSPTKWEFRPIRSNHTAATFLPNLRRAIQPS